MSRHNLSYQRHFESAVDILRGRWMLAVLGVVANRRSQYGEILDEVNRGEVRSGNGDDVKPLSSQILAKTLKRAQDNDLVRKTDDGLFKASWYEITRKGREALTAARPLVEWMQKYDYLHAESPPPPSGRPARASAQERLSRP
ncbi:hypothetical protein [Amycolatopsis ultiminotia]|uniref:winged helix-turn-helix transcriptional regulator n=1 Tax=Amycolatopsis ultiminotia TaxID=543629 RepID=UPI0031ECC284